MISRKRACAALGVLFLLLLLLPMAAMAAGDGGEAATSRWLATDTYKLMNFTVLLVVLIYLLKKPISQALNNRIDGIREQLEELESRKSAAAQELATYADKLSALEAEAQQIVEDYVKQGEAAKARILEEAETTAEKLEEQAKKNIAHEFKQARAQLQEEIVDKAMAKAEAMIKDAVSADDQNKLVEEYLEKVVA
jgi:F-type H+-transporting ATPase subunit b